MKKIGLFILLMTCLSFGLTAQTATSDSDVSAVLGYDPEVVLNDWKQWEETQAANLHYIQEFMVAKEVPQVGMYGFNLHETWYMWISNHTSEIKEYLEIKASNQE